MSLYTITKDASDFVDARSVVAKPRSVYSVFASTTSELGELGVEIMIDQGQSYKKPGKDGVVGEAVDTILCLLDLIHVYDPTITEAELNTLAAEKCEKWKQKVSKA